MKPSLPSGESVLRGSAEAWLDASYEILIESGIDAVKILRLSQRLNLSRTSFYWLFRDRDELLGALLEKWKALNTGGLVRQSQAYAETIAEAMLNIFDCWLDPGLFDSKFEFSVRSWALQSASVAAQVQKADKLRLAALEKMFERFGFSKEMAEVRALTAYSCQMGWITMRVGEDKLTRMRHMPPYVEVLTGVAPTKSQLRRFGSRHGLSADRITKLFGD